MALANLTFNSNLLHRPVSLAILLPENAKPKGILYLLHGFSDRYDSALYYSSLPRLFADLPVAVVMPDAQCSFYLDTAYGQPFWRHISEEIPMTLRQWLHFEFSTQLCFVAGLSMGGYGAAKLALSKPEIFSEAFLFSPVTDLAAIVEHGFDRSKDDLAPRKEDLHFDRLLGGRHVQGSQDDLFYLLDQVDPEKLPKFTLYTGTEDFLYGDIIRFTQALDTKKVNWEMLTCEGLHRWKTWDSFMEHMAAQIAAKL